MSTTPKTDTMLASVIEHDEGDTYDPRKMVPVDFARELERSLAASEAQCAVMQTEIDRLRLKWESEEPGRPGTMARGIFKRIADATDSHYSSRPPAAFLNDILKERSELLERCRKMEEALGLRSPYPVTQILLHLSAATKHLFDTHSCDYHGHEVWAQALEAAEEMVPKIESALSSPTEANPQKP